MVPIALSRSVPQRHNDCLNCLTCVCASHNSYYPLHFTAVLRNVTVISWNTILYQHGKLMLLCTHHGKNHNSSDFLEDVVWGTSLAVHWLRLWASTAGGTGSVPGWGTQIPHLMLCGAAKKKRRCGLRGGGRRLFRYDILQSTMSYVIIVTL